MILFVPLEKKNSFRKKYFAKGLNLWSPYICSQNAREISQKSLKCLLWDKSTAPPDNMGANLPQGTNKYITRISIFAQRGTKH